MSRTALARAWPLTLAACALALMLRSWYVDPFDPALAPPYLPGHNNASAPLRAALLVLFEVALLYPVVRPGRPEGSPGRALFGLVTSLPWTALALLLATHSGGIYRIHVLWLVAVDVALAATLVSRLVTRTSR